MRRKVPPGDMEHAAKTADNSLQECPDRLKSREQDRQCGIVLYDDHAPLSFYFEMNGIAGNRIINGGILYHGHPDESFAVQLVPQKGRQIHT